MLVPMAFWLLLGEIYAIAQARRLSAAIGLGTQLAMTGAAVARAMSSSLDAQHLLGACTSTRAAAPCSQRVGPGRPHGLLEAAAGEPRWFDAVAETAGVVLEQDVKGVADVFEDNVDVALDYLAWVSRTTLDLIERELGPGRELLEFLRTLASSE